MEPKVLYPHSQTHVLQQRLEAAGVRRGADARVDLEFEVMADVGGPTAFFCEMIKRSDAVRVRHFARRGDGRELPAKVEIRGFHVPLNLKFGSYRLEYARLKANSRLLFVCDQRTRILRLEESLED